MGTAAPTTVTTTAAPQETHAGFGTNGTLSASQSPPVPQHQRLRLQRPGRLLQREALEAAAMSGLSVVAGAGRVPLAASQEIRAGLRASGILSASRSEYAMLPSHLRREIDGACGSRMQRSKFLTTITTSSCTRPRLDSHGVLPRFRYGKHH